MLAGCGASSPTALPSGSVSELPSASAGGTPTPTSPVGGVQLPEVGCCYGREIDPGRYAAPRFFPFWASVEVAEGWRGLRNGSDRIFAFVQGRNEIGHSTHYLAFFGIERAEADAFLDEFGGTELLEVADPEPAEIGGLTGERIAAEAAPNPDMEGTPERVAGSVRIQAITALTNPMVAWYTESAEARLRLYVLDATDEHVLLVYVEAPPEDFDAFAAAVDEILATLLVAPK